MRIEIEDVHAAALVQQDILGRERAMPAARVVQCLERPARRMGDRGRERDPEPPARQAWLMIGVAARPDPEHVGQVDAAREHQRQVRLIVPAQRVPTHRRAVDRRRPEDVIVVDLCRPCGIDGLEDDMVCLAAGGQRARVEHPAVAGGPSELAMEHR